MIATKDLMNSDVIAVDLDDTVWEVMATMLKHGVSGVPVVNMPGQLLGFVSEFDLIEHLLRARRQLPRELHAARHTLPAPRAFDLRHIPHNQDHA